MAHSLVTGGQGFIGSVLARALLEDGDTVTVLDRPEPPFEGLRVQGVDEEVELIVGDVADPGDSDRATKRADRVFHLGAVTLVGQAAGDPLGTYRSNVEGTWTLLEACRSNGPEVVVVASSDKAYGPSKSLPYRTSNELRPVSTYEGSKAACDVLARSYHGIWGMPLAVTRLANVYGGGDLNFTRLVPELMAAAVRERDPEIRSDGTPKRDFLHVSDAVAGYLAVAELVASGRGSGRAFNLGTGFPTSVGEVIELASRVSGRELVARAPEGGGAEGEIDEQYVDSSEIEDSTPWRPRVGLEEGLREASDWYSRNASLCP